MARRSGVLFAGLVISGAAHAQGWQTYTYPDPGFAIEFPGIPNVQTTKSRNAAGVTVPVTQYVVRQDGVQYTLSVANYSRTNADALRTISETARSFTAKGRVNANTGARVNGNHGRELTITETDGSRSDIAIFFVNNYLYTAVGEALPPNAVQRATDTARFQRSLRFLGDDSGFLGLFGGKGRTGSGSAASTVTLGRPNANVTSKGNGRAGTTIANQRADAACTGKSAGDLVQLDTPAGPVPATCTLTARPNPPHGTPEKPH